MPKYYSIFIFIILVTTSCSKTETDNPTAVNLNKGGIFILNEGNYSVANSSLSYFYPNEDSTQNSLFYKANNAPLGDVAQSITLHKNTAYIVINNSGLIYGVNSKTIEFEGKISGLVSPREMVIISDNKAYVSDLYNTSITIVNPQEYIATGHIQIGKSTDGLVKHGNYVFGANWSSYNQTTINNTVMIIDSENDMIVDSIVVGIEPNSMVFDKNNQLWVLCSGGFMNEEKPTLWQINPVTFEIVKSITFSDILHNPENLCINGNGDSLYFVNKDIYGMSISDNEIPTSSLIPSDEKLIYTISVDPVNNDIYISDAIDYNQSGTIYRYNSTGTLISSFEAGIIPGDIMFNY